MDLRSALAAAGIVGILGGTVGSHFDREDYLVTVTDKERVVNVSHDKDGNTTSTSKYLVFTELPDGSVRVFENTDSLLELKFNSSDLQGTLREGRTYKIHTYGWRIPFFSAYENIVKVESAE